MQLQQQVKQKVHAKLSHMLMCNNNDDQSCFGAQLQPCLCCHAPYSSSFVSGRLNKIALDGPAIVAHISSYAPSSCVAKYVRFAAQLLQHYRKIRLSRHTLNLPVRNGAYAHHGVSQCRCYCSRTRHMTSCCMHLAHVKSWAVLP